MFETTSSIPEVKNPRPRTEYWLSVAEAARNAPGEYIVLEDEQAAIAHFIKNGTYRAFAPAGSYEAVARNCKRGEGAVRATIYVKYLGV